MLEDLMNFFKGLFGKKKPPKVAPVEPPIFSKPEEPAPIQVVEAPKYFNEYIIQSVNYLSTNFANRGYSLKYAYAKPIPYGKNAILGTIMPTGKQTDGTYGKSMCVAAMQETIMEAMNLYGNSQLDKTVWDFLPFSSWKGFGVHDIHASIWVDPSLDSFGTADALTNFAMGERCKFSELKKGGFVGFNRTSGTGHAVCFWSFIDKEGNELPAYTSDVAGFKYFSCQGSGFSFRYAFFSQAGSPLLPADKKRDLGVIYSDNRKVLNCGHMWHPGHWGNYKPEPMSLLSSDTIHHTDPKLWDGLTVDCIQA